MEIVCSAQHQLSLVGDNSLVHELRVMAAVELHVCQHPALKSVYGKSQSVMGGKLLSSYRTVFELAHGLRDSKTSDLNCSYKVLVQKEVLTICQDRVFASFLCILSLSVLGRFIHLYCDSGSLGRSTPAWGVNSPFSPAFLHICCKYIIEDRRKIPSLIAFYKLFLSDIKVMILINSWHFLTVFLDVLSAAL